MRVNLRVILFALVAFSFFLSFTLVTRCRDSSSSSQPPQRQSAARCSAAEVALVCANRTPAAAGRAAASCASEHIDVDVNDGQALVSGRKEGREVFVPFSFVRKYFDIYGEFAEDEMRFRWSHSYSKVFRPSGPYSLEGPFMSFENFKVEARDRVKCISAVDGVPISTQWGQQGYYYPIQIAQFGLSHYSKEAKRKIGDVDDDPNTVADDEDVGGGESRLGFSWLRRSDRDSLSGSSEMIEDAEDRGHLAKWALPRDEAKATRIHDAELETNVFHFQTDAAFSDDHAALASREETGVAVRFHPGHTHKLTLSADLHFLRNSSSISVTLEARGRGLFQVHYVGGCSAPLTPTPDGRHFLYGLGDRSNRKWIELTRDLAIDLQKGLLLTKPGRKWAAKTPRVTLLAITLHGEGYLDNLTLKTEAHLPHFFAAADWFVRNQDADTGGWAIGVTRRLASGLLTIPPGWVSAMGQGQAMSILTRAFRLTNNHDYLRAAVKAAKPFTLPSAEGGVAARLFDKFPWYEEYPTSPPLFVLNGFIYSLIGLYDLSLVAPRDERGACQAEDLFRAGMESLERLLPMFDTGSGSLYDLRHLHLPGVAPNLARWDYHSAHVNQLLVVAGIVEGEKSKKFFGDTAERWIGYMNGKRAPHN